MLRVFLCTSINIFNHLWHPYVEDIVRCSHKYVVARKKSNSLQLLLSLPKYLTLILELVTSLIGDRAEIFKNIRSFTKKENERSFQVGTRDFQVGTRDLQLETMDFQVK